jgi:HAD superfamily hydrolase (TIGR01509 family)
MFTTEARMTLSGQTIRTVPSERRRVEAVLLDLDGTLIASNDAHANAWVDALQEEGIPVRFEHVRPLIGMGGAQLLERLCGMDPDDERAERLGKRRSEIFLARYIGEVEPVPGARELVEKLRDRGFAIVVATSANEKELRSLLSVAGIEDLIDACTTADDVDGAKPAPDIIRAALAKAGVHADHAILIGDTPYDIRAARSANVPVIALRCGGWNDDSLDGAIEVFDDPADLLRNWMQTPFRASYADLDAPL